MLEFRSICVDSARASRPAVARRLPVGSILTALCLSSATFMVLPSPVRGQTAPALLTVTSPTLRAGEPVPKQHTPDGRNDSPALSWSGVPSTARTLIVLCEDPDAGNPPPFVHWAVYNIPASASGLPEALPIDTATAMPRGLESARQGMSGFRRPIYRGPAPPPGKPHSYHFVVYALDVSITEQPNSPPPGRAELLHAAQGHVVGKGELVATYERK